MVQAPYFNWIGNQALGEDREAHSCCLLMHTEWAERFSLGKKTKELAIPTRCKP